MTKITLEFSDEQFLNSSEKTKIYNAWTRFLKSGFKKGNFTDALYRHLHLHCGFIANFSRDGFYNVYFTHAEKTIHFLKCVEDAVTRINIAADLSFAMVKYIESSKTRILKELHEENIKEKEDELKSAKEKLQTAKKETIAYV